MQMNIKYLLPLLSASSLAASALNATVDGFIPMRIASYLQADASTCTPSTIGGQGPYFFIAEIAETGSTLISEASLTLPDDSSHDLVFNSTWQIQGDFTSRVLLDNQCGAGTYTLNLTYTAGGTDSISLEFASSMLDFGDAILIGNFDDIQVVDPTQDMTINWAAATSSAMEAFVGVRITDTEDNDVYVCQYNNTENIPLTVTSATVPPNTLQYGTSYNVDVLFSEILLAEASTDITGTFEGIARATTTRVEFQTMTEPEDSIFANLERTGGWVYPQSETVDSFGWFSDEFYPYIYNASQDILSNGSYLGDGDGYMYIMPGYTADGFYVYRYATQSWGWTSFYWSGWIYDFGTSERAAEWVDITPAN